MTRAALEVGVQLHLPSYGRVPLAALLDAGEAVARAGVDQLWVTDNLEQRSVFVMLAALATRVRVKLGTAVLVPYLHNPVATAAALSTVSELMGGAELSVGLGRGNGRTAERIAVPRPLATLRESARCLTALLAGDEVRMDDFPALGAYFRFAPGAVLRLARPAAGTVRLLGASRGPRGTRIAAEETSGVMFGNTLLADARAGRLAALVAEADRAAGSRAPAVALRRVGEVKLSVAADGAAARAFARGMVVSRVLGLRGRGYTDPELAALGIDPEELARLDGAHRRGVPAADLRALVSDPMLDALCIAGSPRECRARLAEVRDVAARHGLTQVIFSELGPDLAEACSAFIAELLPALR